MSKKIHAVRGLVYSTNPEAMREAPAEPIETPGPGYQKLKVRLDSKRRAGKTVTLVENFQGTEADLQALGKKLKTRCGTGGSVKDGEIIIQGDYKEKIIRWLKDWGYTLK